MARARVDDAGACARGAGKEAPGAEDSRQEFDTAEAGHLHIRNNQRELLLSQSLKRFLNVRRGDAFVSLTERFGE